MRVSATSNRSLRVSIMWGILSVMARQGKSQRSTPSSSIYCFVCLKRSRHEERTRFPCSIFFFASSSWISYGISSFRMKITWIYTNFSTLLAISSIQISLLLVYKLEIVWSRFCIYSSSLKCLLMIQTSLNPFIKLGKVSSIIVKPSLLARFLNCLSKVVRNFTLSLASPHRRVNSFI